MIVLQAGLTLYRFGGTTSLQDWLPRSSMMWLGPVLYFVQGALIGLLIERLLRGTTGRFHTLLVAAAIFATPTAVGTSLAVEGLFGPPGLLDPLPAYLLVVGIPRLIGKGWLRFQH